MAIVVEDGTGVSGANSYVSVADARAYAAARGLTLPTADADVEKLLILAADYTEALRASFQGMKTTGAQAMQWPRIGVYLDGYELGSDAIPKPLVDAQSQLACDAYVIDLMPNSEGRETIMEKVADIQVQYAQSGDSNPQPALTKATSMLAPLLKSGGTLRSIRV